MLSVMKRAVEPDDDTDQPPWQQRRTEAAIVRIGTEEVPLWLKTAASSFFRLLRTFSSATSLMSQTYSTMTPPLPPPRSPILPPQAPPPALAPPASREQPPAWFVEWPEAEQKELQAMVDAIERDAPNGWCNETEIDLQNEFSLSAEQARTIFRCLCSAPLAARLDAERAAEEAAAGGEGGGDGVGDRGGGEGGDWGGEWGWKPSQPISAPAAAELGEAVQTLDLRACPNCSVPVEKIDGCDHMRCKQCRNDFWWSSAPTHAFWW